jgi:hypothetical protein
VNTEGCTISDGGISCIIGKATNGEVDNGGLARGDSMIHSSVDSTNDVGSRARSLVGEDFDGKERGICGRPEVTKMRHQKSMVAGGAVFDLHSGGGASGVGSVAIPIGVGMTAKGSKPGSTSSETLVIDEYSGIDT